MKEVLRILKPGTGYAQFIELVYPYCFVEDDSLASDAPLNKVLPV
jgi:hypothetical protein